MRLPRLPLLLALLAIALLAGASRAAADEGWVVQSFDGDYTIEADGSVSVVEDIRIDFGPLERHGIIRAVPYEYRYDSDRNRRLSITDVAVDDGATPQRFSVSYAGGYVEIKIGDPNVLVTGPQHYVIHYVMTGALNPFDDRDELFVNAVGDEWDVTVEQARAVLTVARPGIQAADCFQGKTGSTDRCLFDVRRSGAQFTATEPLPPGSNLTFVVSLEKGLVPVPPLDLVAARQSVVGQTRDYLGFGPLSLSLAALLTVAVLAGVGRVWWLVGRDRWYGDTYYLSADAPHEEIKPPFAHQTIVVHYTPPEVELDGEGRRLRPAEIGLLLDQRADTLDVSATIVDLAVRRHLMISETPDTGIFSIFRSTDYMLSRLQEGKDADLQPYERKLLDALFDDADTVKLSGLKGKFSDDLQKVKNLLYRASVKQLKHFPRDPENVRGFYRTLGGGVFAAGLAVGFLIGRAVGLGLLAAPVVAGGAGLFLAAPAMPRRSAKGWELYRRCLGFRLYMVTAETDRQRFAEEENIFHEYLPYAIVFGCVDKWADAFAGLGLEDQDVYWYSGTHGFAPARFAASVNSFSTSITGVMAATPGGSGGSGFSGGGFSGGGVGGGGGSSW